MGGGENLTMDGTENEDSSLARNWWNRASSKPAEESQLRRSQESSSQATTEAGKTIASGPSQQETEDLAYLTAVVPRPQPPPSRLAMSRPIDIPKKKTTPPPVFEVAQDKRYWYQ